MIHITIEKLETVWKKSRDWNRVTDRTDVKQYDYVDADLPKNETTLLLSQCIADESFDLAKVIKAVNNL